MHSVKLRINLVCGIVFIIASVVLWMIIPMEIKTRGSTTLIVDARFVPKIAVGLMFVFSLILVLSSIVFKKDKVIVIKLKKELKLLLFFLIMIAYVALIPLIKFIWASLLFGIGALVFMKSRKWQHYIVIIAVIACVQLIFVVILNVPLP